MDSKFIYVIGEKTDENPTIKIGFSGDPAKRLRQLQTAHPRPLVLFHSEAVQSDKVRALESIIHKTLNHCRTKGEWFSLAPNDAVAEVRHAVIRYGDIENLSFRLRSGTIY
jgi:hypothetical protein